MLKKLEDINNIFVRVHDIHCGPKSYKRKLLGKLVVQHGIIALIVGRSRVQISTPYVLFTYFIKFM